MKRFLIVCVALASLPVWAAPPAPVACVAYHPKGEWLVAGGHGSAHVIDVVKREPKHELPSLKGRVTAVSFSADGRWLAIASGEPARSGVIHLYEVEAKGPTLRGTLEGHKDVLYSLAFAPNGKQLASAGYDRTIKVWDVATRTLTSELKDHSDTVYGLAYHPQGALLASAGADRAVKVWDVAASKRLYTLSDATDWVYAIAWHPNGTELAAAGVDKSIRVWKADRDGGKLVHSVFAHQEAVGKLLYTPDGRSLFSASEAKSIKRWDSTKMVEQLVFPPQAETILALAVRGDGKELAVGRFDGVCQLLDSATGKLVAEPLPVKPKPPTLNKVSPNFGVRGQTLPVTFEGSALAEATFTSSGPGVVVQATPQGYSVTVAKDAPVGPVTITAKNAAGLSTGVTFIVDRFPVSVDATGNDATKTGQVIQLPRTIAGKLTRAGEADYFRFDAKAGQQVGVQVLTTVLGSKMEPVLELTAADGTLLAESTKGFLGYTCPVAGTYAIGIRDQEFRGGADQFYRLHIGDVPVLTSVLPLGVRRGQATTVNLVGVHLPARNITVTPAADATGRFALPLDPTAEKPLGDASVLVGEFPEVLVRERQADVPVPGTANGVLHERGAEQQLAFRAKKGQRLLIESNARRIGSPVDTVLEVLDAKGQPVERNTLRCTARVFVTFRDHDSVTPGIRLETWNELAINDYVYLGNELLRIKQLPLNPDADCNFFAVDGKRFGFLDTTTTQHPMGAPMYKVELHPPGASFPANGMPTFRLYYRNDDGGPGYGKDSRLFFDVPSDGEYRVRVRDARGAGGLDYAYRVTIREPREDFTVSMSNIPAVWQGGAVPVNVTATRLDGYDGPINLKLANLPAGWEAPATVIEAGQQTTSFTVHAPAKASPLPKDVAPFKLIASATIHGKAIVHEVMGSKPSVVEPGDIVTFTSVHEVTIKPGQETRLKVRIERQNKFAGRVPVEVRGLPHGVRVLDIGLNGILITPGNTEREIVLYAEPWVQATEMPFVVLARREGKNTEHAAKSVLLKVRE